MTTGIAPRVRASGFSRLLSLCCIAMLPILSGCPDTEVPVDETTPTESPIVTNPPAESPTATQPPTSTPTPVATPTLTPTQTPSGSPTPSGTPAPTDAPTDTPAPTDAPTDTPAPTPAPTSTPEATPYPDTDEDGYTIPLDCNDSDAEIHPNAEELCDDLDNNCDGTVDEGFDSIPEVCDGLDNNCNGSVDEPGAVGGQTYYADSDGDGFGDANVSVSACTQPPGSVTNADDCDDAQASANPLEVEVCDGIDNNCDDVIDEDSAADAPTWYSDADLDGYGTQSSVIVSCEQPAGYALNDGDCNDSSTLYYPGAPESCTTAIDYNCDGATSYADTDADGVPACSDCNDKDASTYPGASELCDGADNNCNNTLDEGVTSTYHPDKDSDGFGDASQSVQACAAPSGYVSDASDCNDNNSSAYPGATEICNSIDDNCDGTVDELNAGGCRLFYNDKDGDTWGASGSQCLCAAPVGSVTRSGDCDDNNPSVYPGQTEKCNGIDDDCDSEKDETNAQGCTRLYADHDDDSYGTSSDYACLCDAANDYTAEVGGDCLDSDATVYPGGLETCDGKDNNCNGQIDEGVKTTYYIDSDGDGFGASYNSKEACSAPTGYVTQGGDCNDYSKTINPAAPEVCDSIDNNCNGSIDEGLTQVTYYVDLDGDGHGAKNTSGKKGCLIDSNGDGTGDVPPDGYASVADDCNDSDSTVYPGANELCDGLDNNCDTYVDTQCPSDCPGTWPVALSIPGHMPARMLDRDGDSIEELYVIDSSGKLQAVNSQGTKTTICSALSFSTGYGSKFGFTVNPSLLNSWKYYLVQGTRIYDLDSCAEVLPSANDVSAYGSVGDFDGDGKLDYAGHNEATSSICAKLSGLNYTTTCIASPNGKGYDGYLTSIDMNLDGKSDLITPRGAPYPTGVDNTDGSLDIFSVQSNALFLRDSLPASMTGLTTAHMFGPDYADVFNDGYTRRTVLINGRVIDLASKTQVGTYAGDNIPNPRTYDLDKNGTLDGARQGALVDLDYDLVAETIRASGTQISIVKNTTGTPVMDGWPVSVGTISWSVSPVVGDIDNDGRLDVYVPGSGAMYCYRLGKGSANFTNIIERGEPEWVNRTMTKDPYEPNNSLTQSWPLRFPTKELRGYLSKNDVDYYRVQGVGGIYVQLYSPSGLDFDFTITNPDGSRTYASGTTTNALDQAAICPACQGETLPSHYVVKVSSKTASKDFSNSRPYVLKINYVP